MKATELPITFLCFSLFIKYHIIIPILANYAYCVWLSYYWQKRKKERFYFHLFDNKIYKISNSLWGLWLPLTFFQVLTFGEVQFTKHIIWIIGQFEAISSFILLNCVELKFYPVTLLYIDWQRCVYQSVYWSLLDFLDIHKP